MTKPREPEESQGLGPASLALAPEGWAHPAAVLARSMALHPPGLQLRRLLEDPGLVDLLLLAEALGLVRPSTRSALHSACLRHVRRHALVRVHRRLTWVVDGGNAGRLGQRALERVASDLAAAWLAPDARWPA